MVILELITLDKSRYYYNEEKTELKIDRISFDVARMGKNYSPGFVNLLKGCLQPDPGYRLSLELANQELVAVRKGLKSMTYCIRLQEDEERAKKKGVRREITMSAKGQHILDGLQKKLTPSPIATLSTSISPQYQIESNRNSGRTSTTNSMTF